MTRDYQEVELKLPKLNNENAGDILKLSYFYCIGFTQILDMMGDEKIMVEGKRVYQMRMKNIIKQLESELVKYSDCFKEYYYKNEDDKGTLFKCSENITNLLQVIGMCSIEEMGIIGYLGNLAVTDKAKFNTLTIGILGSPLLKKLN
jgi:hypothetical protein